MKRPKSYRIEVTADVDSDVEDTKEKRKQIREAIEGLDPSIGVFTVESIELED